MISVLVLGIVFSSGMDTADNQAYYNRHLGWMLKNVTFKTGDLVFRRGKSFASQAVLLTDKNSNYSHVGILFISAGKPFVIHAVPDESGDGRDVIKCEKLESFLSFERASRAGIYRIPGLSEETLEKVVGWGRKAFDARLRFDDEYNLSTDDKLYCTELIWKCYRSVGIDLVKGRYDNLSIPLMSGRYILPGRLICEHILTKIHSL
ncbi:MAG: YiiX/YebB-like N1pC/P60 family cysteine hydrolase [Bacteroidetes bacterium]|nr:YiiX/YebB-like N1pC/P60 family cysteine hydrolase [Bacteroidota bacterium]